MKINFFLVLIIIKTLLLSPSSYSSDTDEENVMKFVSQMYRGWSFDDAGEGLIKEDPNITFIHCSGSGSTSIHMANEITTRPADPINLVLALREAENEPGYIAVSDPITMEEGWLFVAIKPLNKPWMNIWDSKYSYDDFIKYPLEDAVSAIVNRFIIQVSISQSYTDSDWVNWGESDFKFLMESKNIKATFNRNNNEFNYKKIVTGRLKLNSDYEVDLMIEGRHEGECGNIN